MKDKVIVYFCKASWPARLPFPSFFRVTGKLLLTTNLVPRRVSMLLRFLTANLAPFDYDDNYVDETKELTIVIVATSKDFRLLGECIYYAEKNLTHVARRKYEVIVPSGDLRKAENLLTDVQHVNIRDEDLLLNSNIRSSIRSKHPSRYGWVLQQFLKLDFIANCSESENFLLLDADTILLKPRKWLYPKGRQLLFNSWERHEPYYGVLKALGLDVPKSSLSFVTHHMFIRRSYLLKMFSDLGVSTIEDLCAKVLKVSLDSEESPFSIDYELYGHYMALRHPNSICLAKWSNMNVRLVANQSLDKELSALGSNYASASFHDYL
jgi:hypothetical protein